MADVLEEEVKKDNEVIVDFGSPNSEPQWKFFLAREKYVCYGGARGGGKSWAIIRKAALLALYYAGIQILIVRREYDQLENPIIQPMLKMLPKELYEYNKTDHMLRLKNGSLIKFSNMPDYGATVEGKFQGNSWDILMIDEATQFLESEFRGLAAIVRGDNGLPKRIYLSCNPKPHTGVVKPGKYGERYQHPANANTVVILLIAKGRRTP